MQLLQGIAQSMNRVAGSGASEDFSRVGLELAQLKGKVREELQAATALYLTRIIQKLEDRELLSPREREVVSLWIVGDAEGYTKMENDFREWQAEFRRLSGVLERYEGQELSPPALVELQGVLEDAVRVTADISNFLEKKERIERFHQDINNFTPEDAKFLISMLKSMLYSPEL